MHYENKLLRIESSCKFVQQFPKRQAFIKKNGTKVDENYFIQKNVVRTNV